MILKTRMLGQTYEFRTVKEVLAKASEKKSGDELAGVGASSALERIAGKEVLSQLTVADLRNHPSVPYEEDAVTRIIQDDLDEMVYEKIKNKTIQEMREWILDDATDSEALMWATKGMTSEVIAGISKLMSNMDLILAGSKIRVTATCNTTIGTENVLAARLQPNHPIDDPEGVAASTFEGLSYGSGDAVIGLNPAIDTVDSTIAIWNVLGEIRDKYQIPTQTCVLSHVTTQMEALRTGNASADLCFQSIAGSESALAAFAGGTYNYAKRGLNRVWANLAGWHYIISVVGIGAGETLAFSNYFKILFSELGWDIGNVDSRWIALILVLFFLVLNLRGIEMSGKAQTGFIFFFWGCSIAWFLYMIPKVHFEYFGGIAMDSLPPFNEMMYIFGLVWWCYTGFETCVSMGAETKHPQYTLPRALKVSVFLVFALNALFQWFLVALVPHTFYNVLAVADAPYAEGLRAAGLVGFPIILLCIGIAFGGDLSTINPGIAAPARYIYTMAEDGSLPKFLCKVHPKYKTPYMSVVVVGIINIVLIVTGSINYIASVSLISLAICYMIGCLAYLGLKKHYPEMNRPYKAPAGKIGCYFTIICYSFMLIFADQVALLTSGIVTVLAVLYWALFTRKHEQKIPTIEEEIGEIEEPSKEEKKSMDREYKVWKIGTAIVTVLALGIYVVPIILS